MRFEPLPLSGVYLVEPELRLDERGFFARTWCREEFAAHGLCTDWVQSSLSFNAQAGTLRGLHYQRNPPEIKLLRCTMGAIFDVIVDLRPGSATWGQWLGLELSAQNRRQLYVPANFAHGFQTLVDASEVHYQMSAFYQPEEARGVRWNDPRLAIRWPSGGPRLVSPRDALLPLLAS